MLYHKIMLIDDNQALREAMALTLRLNNCEVTENYQLQPIFEQSHLPDLYIIDYWLHDLEGISVCRILKENVPTREIPILIMSGDSTVEAAVYISGADAFLQKPFSMKQLLDTIHKLLNIPGVL